MGEPPHIHHLSSDEMHIERIFTSSVKRLASDQFSFALLLKHPHPIHGDLGAWLKHDFGTWNADYSKMKSFLNKLMSLWEITLQANIMEVVPMNQRKTLYCYHIPYHCIVCLESKTNKLRIVFDAFAVTTVGQSLNANLYTGRKLQQDLPRILICALVHKVLFIADIKQMYGEIEIRAEDRDYLRIIYGYLKPMNQLQHTVSKQ